VFHCPGFHRRRFSFRVLSSSTSERHYDMASQLLLGFYNALLSTSTSATFVLFLFLSLVCVSILIPGRAGRTPHILMLFLSLQVQPNEEFNRTPDVLCDTFQTSITQIKS
jgi:hypothetical protein